MNICEQCGAANGELESQCRICGNALSNQFESVKAEAAPAAGAVAEEPAAAPPPQLQVSSVRRAAPTGAPPMLSSASPQEPERSEPEPGRALPGFMQEGARAQHAAASQSVELISANDLPDWIRQIAEADAAKAAAEAPAAPVQAEAPAPIAKRAMPGETRTSGPAANWLSKSGTGQESAEQWAAEETAAANWGAAEPQPAQHMQPHYPTISHTPAPYTPPTPSRRRFARPQLSSSGSPIYRSRPAQLAVLVILLIVLALLIV